ncbi:MAG: 4-hydroxythreonine-4-phosphate dehydrogenase PdxA [Planctomycetota bacterium]
MTGLPKIAITMGDPAGIGPEICLKFLAAQHWRDRCVPQIFGDVRLLARVAEAVGIAWRDEWTHHEGWAPDTDAPIIHLDALDPLQVTAGQFDAATGKAAFAYLDQAISATLDQQVTAIVTAPINKAALHAAGIDYPGHTEILTARTAAPQSCMMLTSDQLTCSLVTTHVGHREVAGLLSTDRVKQTIDLTAAAMRTLHRREPRLAVCGLNPHAGEAGLFGNDEERRVILPAILAARDEGLDVEGPLAPDTAFLPVRRAQFDAYVCMYHDQGLIPIKMLSFDTAVNVTLGLPIVRTSVDHGTAGEIAWTGKAQFSSLSAAVEMALRLVA